MQAELLLDAKAILGEGPYWDATSQALYWVDIMSSELHRYTPSTGSDEVFNVGQHVGTVVLDETDHVLLAVRDGFARFDLETETLTMLAEVEADNDNIRFNDGKCDPAGRFWAGTMAYDMTPHEAKLYCLDTDGIVSLKEQDVTISNGIVWSSDHTTMYYVDSPARVIYAYDYDATTGNISNQRIVIKVPSHMGTPDGMAIDTQDQLWVAHWGYGAVVCWCPTTGEPIQEIAVPVQQVSACAFGGDDLKTLYITTARQYLSDADLETQPLAGGLFVAQTEIEGTLAHRFGG